MDGLDILKLEQFLRKREKGEITWITESGKHIPINDLSDEYLDNLIKKIESNPKYKVTSKEIKRHYKADISVISNEEVRDAMDKHFILWGD